MTGTGPDAPALSSRGLSVLGDDEEDEAAENARIEAERRKKGKPPGVVSRLLTELTSKFKRIDNRLEYLRSVLIDKNPGLVRAFVSLQVEGRAKGRAGEYVHSSRSHVARADTVGSRW
jgi:hypothetical protein